MNNFLIFLSITVVVVLAASDFKHRMEELDNLSKSQKTQIEIKSDFQNKSDNDEFNLDMADKKSHNQ